MLRPSVDALWHRPVSFHTLRLQVLQELLASTERVVQQVDSVEYGLTDIQEYLCVGCQVLMG